MKIENSPTGWLHTPLLFRGIKKQGMLSFILFIGMILYGVSAMACAACTQQQPKFLQGVTHGAGPGSNWDYVIVGIMVLITIYSLYATIKCIINPAEKDDQHIKRIILNQ